MTSFTDDDEDERGEVSHRIRLPEFGSLSSCRHLAAARHGYPHAGHGVDTRFVGTRHDEEAEEVIIAVRIGLKSGTSCQREHPLFFSGYSCGVACRVRWPRGN